MFERNLIWDRLKIESKTQFNVFQRIMSNVACPYMKWTTFIYVGNVVILQCLFKRNQKIGAGKFVGF